MVQLHPSTPEQRVQSASHMLAHAHDYGLVTRLSRELGVSRPTLYAWKAQARKALEQAFLDTMAATVLTPALERQILTVLVEGHTSYSNIQTCLRSLTGQRVSIGTIAAVVAEAQRRALQWMATHAPPTSRTLALDEIYANNRHGAYLNVVDTVSWAVWAAEGPLPVDCESWTLLLWLAQERGLRWHATCSDGGAAIAAACQKVDPNGQHGRDVWHIFQTWSQVQGRLERQLQRLQERTAVVERQAARIAAGQKPKGHHPRTDVAAHAAEVAQAQRTLSDLQTLGQELQRLLAVVVLSRHGLLGAEGRQEELETLLALLAEVRSQAGPGARGELKRLHSHLRQALPHLLAFVAPLERVEQEMVGVLGASGLALVGWAWQRRAILGQKPEQLLSGLPESWRAAARVLLHTWDGAVRASSAVENWHSILRPHLAVHRTLSAGLLAVLAVWHNHRVFTRGVHCGQSPLQLSGMIDAPTDWLVALGYPPADGMATATPAQVDQAERALAA
jgi:transposase-like protein